MALKTSGFSGESSARIHRHVEFCGSSIIR